jgi:exonuclease III
MASTAAPRLPEWLVETQPDVVRLQELKSPPERFPQAEFAKAGHGATPEMIRDRGRELARRPN